MCKIINWFKSLFKKEEIQIADCEIKTEPQPEIQAVKKSKKRGRPRKKKKVDQTTNPQQA